MEVTQFLSFLLVASLWGCTNPLLKKGTKKEEVSKRYDNPVAAFLAPLWSILSNWKFLLPFALNQSGSVVYVYLLGDAEISMAVPICNSLTTVFTAITSQLLGERIQHPMRTYAGIALILIGVAICVHSKIA